jgi:NO-binding membrane sensor protein with MHYT domain
VSRFGLAIGTLCVVGAAALAQHGDVGKTAALVAVCVGVGIPAAYVLLLLAANICTGPCTWSAPRRRRRRELRR